MTLYVIDPEAFPKTGITQTIMQAPGEERPERDNYRGLTLEEYRQAVGNPNLVALTWEELEPLHEAYKKSLQDPWQEVTEQAFDIALESLPPQKWRDITPRFNVFYLQEAYTADLHTHYVHDREEEKYYKALRSRFSTDAQLLAELYALDVRQPVE